MGRIQANAARTVFRREKLFFPCEAGYAPPWKQLWGPSLRPVWGAGDPDLPCAASRCRTVAECLPNACPWAAAGNCPVPARHPCFRSSCLPSFALLRPPSPSFVLTQMLRKKRYGRQGVISAQIRHFSPLDGQWAPSVQRHSGSSPCPACLDT